MFRRIAVGISGGVDSAVSAYILKNKGFSVIGVFMRNWDIIDETGTCSVQKDLTDAEIVCKTLEIPLVQVDFVKEYWNEVFTNLVKDYENGWTPNPDILCNKHIKFNSFYNYCLNTLQMDAIATGHYANTSFGPYLEKYKDGEDVRLLEPTDNFKDQTYFLSQVSQLPLRKTMFPIALLKKSQVREIAKNQGLLNVASKRDSVGICFVGKRNFQEFISEYVPSKPGAFVDIDTGIVVGSHNGIHQWTIGQRCNIGGKSKAYFVARKSVKDNIIYTALGTDNPTLYARIFFTGHAYWIREEPDSLRKCDVLNCYFRFQHIDPLIKCRVVKTPNGMCVVLEKSLRAITPGQFAVFYKDGECLGSSVIFEVGPSDDVYKDVIVDIGEYNKSVC